MGAGASHEVQHRRPWAESGTWLSRCPWASREGRAGQAIGRWGARLGCREGWEGLGLPLVHWAALLAWWSPGGPPLPSCGRPARGLSGPPDALPQGWRLRWAREAAPGRGPASPRSQGAASAVRRPWRSCPGPHCHQLGFASPCCPVPTRPSGRAFGVFFLVSQCLGWSALAGVEGGFPAFLALREPHPGYAHSPLPRFYFSFLKKF